MRLVLDSSAIAKLLVEEPGTREAQELVGLAHSIGLELSASQLAVCEVGNVLARALRGTADDGRALMEHLFLLDIAFLPVDAPRAAAASAIAHERGVTFYDAVHLALAEEFRCPLVTEDRELVAKGRGVVGLVEAVRLAREAAG